MTASDANPTGNSHYLLTPGPLTTALATKQAMLRDWGSRDRDFIDLTARVHRRLVELAGGADSHVSVLVQGSGTFVIEATLGTLVPRAGKALVLINGAYGHRIKRILDIMGRSNRSLETPEDVASDVAALDGALDADPAITHVCAVQCETTTGILNPIERIAEVVARHSKSLIVDAMSAFGALPFDLGTVPCDAVVASANKCLEGVPGIGFAVVRRSVLAEAAGNAHSLSLDLHAQWQGFEGNGQWRFTPPTHVLAAFDRALAAHAAEGGIAGRGRRYQANCRRLVAGMRELGFETLLPDELQAPIIVTFRMPADPKFTFQDFYDRLHAKGFVIYPGKLTVAESFRIGCIGAVGEAEIAAALGAISETLREMGVTTCAPERAA